MLIPFGSLSPANVRISRLVKSGAKNFSFTRGPKHTYLGMDLDYSEKGVFKVSMIPYIDKIHEDFPELISKSAPAPHTDNLFKIRDESEAKYLPEEQAVLFHHSVAQLLFLACRARRDIQVSVAFLTTRVKKPDEDDWGKLRRILQYLKGTRSLPLRLTIDNLTFSIIIFILFYIFFIFVSSFVYTILNCVRLYIFNA